MNTEQINFAYKVRHALNETLDDLPASTADRLAVARAKALSRKKKDSPLRAFVNEARLAGAGYAGSLVDNSWTWLNRMGIVIPMLVLVGGLMGIYQFEQQYHISEIADIDAAVLADELPLTAYLDHGFNAYLSSREE